MMSFMIFDSGSARGACGMDALFAQLECMCAKLPYPIGRVKSIVGRGKFIFLNDGFVEGDHTALPLRVAINADADQIPAIRALRGDIDAYFSTASSIACNGGWLPRIRVWLDPERWIDYAT